MIEITPLGDSALTVRFAKVPAKSPNDLLARVLAAKRALDDAAIPGVIETTTSYSTVGVFLDMPALLDTRDAREPFDHLVAAIHEVVTKQAGKTKRGVRPQRLEVPVCFDPVLAPDLAGLAEFHSLSTEVVVKKFCAADYQVASIGFTPGFPYLLGLSPELRTARRATPRVSVPAGSVAIGNDQAGIYPIESPGGWNLIGQTPLLLFDAAREAASLLAAGDHLRFRAVGLDEFHQIRSEARP